MNRRKENNGKKILLFLVIYSLLVILFNIFSGTDFMITGFSIFSNMAAPSVGSVILNSTSNNNFTTDNLTCWNFSVSDADNDPVKIIFNWYKNNASLINLYLPFEENGSASLVAKDYSGYGHNGKINGATFNLTGGIDGFGAYEFDGNNDVINTTINPFTNAELASGATITAWIKPNLDKTRNFIFDDEGYFNIEIDANGRFSVTCDGGTHLFTSTPSLINNSWYHVSVVYDTTSGCLLYINGALNTSSASDVPTPDAQNRPFSIGMHSTSLFSFNGTIDEVRVYNYSLSKEQIKLLYESEPEIISLEETSAGENWKCEVIPNDGTSDGSSLNSTGLVVVAFPVEVCDWKNCSSGAISYVFDDGTWSHYGYAYPLFRDRNLTFTIGVVANGTNETCPNPINNCFYNSTYAGPSNVTWPQFDEMYNHGVELSCHGYNHCATDDACFNEELEWNLSRNIIAGNTSIPSYSSIVTYVMPGGHDLNSTQRSDIQTFGFIAARDNVGGEESKSPSDMFNINSYNIDETPASTWNGYVDTAVSDKNWSVFMLHKVCNTTTVPTCGTYDTTINPTIMRAHLDYVVLNVSKNVTVCTFEACAKYINERNNLTVPTLIKTSSWLNFTIKDDLDDSVYDEKVTIKVDIEDNEKVYSVLIDGSEVNWSNYTIGTNGYIIFDTNLSTHSVSVQKTEAEESVNTVPAVISGSTESKSKINIQKDLTEPQLEGLYAGDKLEFLVNDQKHNLKVVYVNEEYAKLELNMKQIKINKFETKLIDLDNDNLNDVKITLKDIKFSKAILNVELIQKQLIKEETSLKEKTVTNPVENLEQMDQKVTKCYTCIIKENYIKLINQLNKLGVISNKFYYKAMKGKNGIDAFVDLSMKPFEHFKKFK